MRAVLTIVPCPDRTIAVTVFITDFADNADFLPEDIGYAAIARGFGLIEGDGETFRPYDTLTRAEAVTVAENVIELGLLN